jgi:hypothetical protein
MPTAPRVHQIHVLEFPLVDVVTVAVAVEFVEDVQFIEQLMVPFNVGDITGEVVFNDGDITGEVVFNDGDITGEVVFNDGDITGEVVFNDGDITGEVVFNDGDITGEVVFIDGDIAGEMEATGGVPHAAAAHIWKEYSQVSSSETEMISPLGLEGSQPIFKMVDLGFKEQLVPLE